MNKIYLRSQSSGIFLFILLFSNLGYSGGAGGPLKKNRQVITDSKPPALPHVPQEDPFRTSSTATDSSSVPRSRRLSHFLHFHREGVLPPHTIDFDLLFPSSPTSSRDLFNPTWNSEHDLVLGRTSKKSPPSESKEFEAARTIQRAWRASRERQKIAKIRADKDLTVLKLEFTLWGLELFEIIEFEQIHQKFERTPQTGNKKISENIEEIWKSLEKQKKENPEFDCQAKPEDRLSSEICVLNFTYTYLVKRLVNFNSLKDNPKARKDVCKEIAGLYDDAEKGIQGFETLWENEGSDEMIPVLQAVINQCDKTVDQVARKVTL